MALVAFHSVTFGTKPPVPIHELCFTSDPWTFRGWLRGLAFTIVIAPFMLLWVLIQIALAVAFLMFVAAMIYSLFKGL